MPTKEQLRSRLMKKLQELFQLNQPDLDFGFYRIMHAKAKQVQEFIDKDLLKIVEDAFGQGDEARKLVLKAKVDEAVEQAKKYGAPDPEGTTAVKEARAKYNAALDTAAAEADVYDHLYRFFERYYDDGDFISLRYSTKETPGKAAPFAVPYNGEEVKLHWANADQYYIKTTEYFSNCTFDLTQTQEIRALLEQPQLGLKWNTGDDTRLKVHFRILEATEGEHGNVKESESDKRYFLIHTDKPIDINEIGELVINFEYRPDTEKTGQEGSWQDKRNVEAVSTVLAKLEEMAKSDTRTAGYLQLLMTPSPTESDKKRPLLAKYINKYTARNTMDYFIHKDLGGFLRRELDFYIKNEVMRLDDIENAEAPDVESYLAKLKVLRKIAGKLIDFLDQLEGFQRKLWLKKKFVVETNYCITLDRVPDELYPEIAANQRQHDEWVKLYAINEIAAFVGDEVTPSTLGYSQPLTVEFLKTNNKLVLDTRFYDEVFKTRLLSSIDNFDEQCDGLLLHSENYQGLNLLEKRYQKQVKCIYIDPPYNGDSTPILYKNGYRHSSWASLMWDRLNKAKIFAESNGIHSIAIDDIEMVNISKILEDIFPEDRLSRITVIHNPKGSITKDFNRVHEYALFLTNETDKAAIARTLEENDSPRKMRRWGENSLRIERRPSFYPIYVKDGSITRVGVVPPDDVHPAGRNIKVDTGEIEIWPIDQDGNERRWNFGLDTIHENIQRITIQEVDNTLDLFLTHELTVPKTVWSGGEYDAGNYGNTLLINILGDKQFDFPKSINLVKRCIYLATASNKNGTILDYFGGSGTTAHATVTLNKEDQGKRKYILIEMGIHFDKALMPRIEKIIYAADWKDGKPTARQTGISHCFKYLRLESYEDTLNNLEFSESPVRQAVIMANPSLKEDYTLHYLLNVETRGSQSLLNIDHFSDPKAYKLKIKKPGSDEQVEKQIDLIETFDYLIGLRVNHVAVPQTLNADFKRIPDPELPDDQHSRLVVDGNIRQDTTGPWWFRKVEGWVPKDSGNTNSSEREKVLIVWRKLTGDLEKDNLMLDEWFKKNRISTLDFEFSTIYVNGSNNLPNLAQPGDSWKVRLIEEEFMKRMWGTENS